MVNWNIFQNIKLKLSHITPKLATTCLITGVTLYLCTRVIKKIPPRSKNSLNDTKYRLNYVI